jgi:hypothetical protein
MPECIFNQHKFNDFVGLEKIYSSAGMMTQIWRASLRLCEIVPEAQNMGRHEIKNHISSRTGRNNILDINNLPIFEPYGFFLFLMQIQD